MDYIDIKEFDIGAILAYTTGYGYVDDFLKVYEIAWFMYNDNRIKDTDIYLIRGEIKRHLLEIHPELKEVKYSFSEDPIEFTKRQELIFGKTLPVTRAGVKLPKDKVKSIGEK